MSKPLKVAFDIDDTLWKCTYPFNKDLGKPYLRQVPDYDLIAVLRWFHANGDEIFFWSAGGAFYCRQVVEKLGIDHLGSVVAKGSFKPDIAFDDQQVKLGAVNVLVEREVPEELKE